MALVMKTITVELTAQMAEQLLPEWEHQRDQKLAEANGIDAQIKRVRAALQDTKDGGRREITAQAVVPTPKTSSGRNKRGMSKKVIAQFLKMRNGNGATIKEITAETETVYGTARRVLQQLEKENKAVKENGLWKAANEYHT